MVRKCEAKENLKKMTMSKVVGPNDIPTKVWKVMSDVDKMVNKFIQPNLA